jgi:hypothetical protein
MSTYRSRLALLAVLSLGLGLAFVLGCSSGGGGKGPAQRLFGVSAQAAQPANGLGLSADPAQIIIDPSTPVDPNHNNERFVKTVLLALATDPAGAPQDSLAITFAASAGVLASGGVARLTDTLGFVRDTLTVHESDPSTIDVSVTQGDRVTTIVLTKLVEAPPVANAGPDQTLECTGDSSSTVTLDGSASTDPNNDITLYQWFEHFGAPDSVLLGTGKSLTVSLPDGEHVITLRVRDSTGLSSTDEVVVKVADTQPPILRLTLTPSSLWPPNHKMVHIHAAVDVDECSSFTVTLVSVRSNEPDNGLGDGDTSNDIQGVDAGTADTDFDLRAERSGPGSGRVYTATYRVVDSGGHETLATGRVVVKHDQGH